MFMTDGPHCVRFGSTSLHMVTHFCVRETSGRAPGQCPARAFWVSDQSVFSWQTSLHDGSALDDEAALEAL